MLKIISKKTLFFIILFSLNVIFCFDSISQVKKIISFGMSKIDNTRKIDVIIIHNVYAPSAKDSFSSAEVLKLFKKYDVSAHYLIDRNSNIIQLVEENNIAFHGGKGLLPDGDHKINTRSIGIELINSKKTALTQQQYLALATLIKDIKNRHRIVYMLKHSDVAPERKSDPWNFNSTRLDSLLK